MVNGADGERLPGFTSKFFTPKSAPIQSLRNFSASSSVVNFFGNSALNVFPPTSKIPTTLKAAVILKTSISRSRSTMSRTATDCTRPADNCGFIFFHKIGESSNPTRRSRIRRAC